MSITLPDALADQIAASFSAAPDGPLRIEDPTRGRTYLLTPDGSDTKASDTDAGEAEEEWIPTKEELAEIQPESDWEAIQRGIADAEAGLGRPLEESRRAIRAELRERV